MEETQLQDKIEKIISKPERKLQNHLHIHISAIKINFEENFEKLISENFAEIESSLETFELFAAQKSNKEELPHEFFERLRWCFDQDNPKMKNLVIKITTNFIENTPEIIPAFAEVDMFQAFISSLPCYNVTRVFRALLTNDPEYLSSLATEDSINFLCSLIESLSGKFRKDLLNLVYSVVATFFAVSAIEEKQAQKIIHYAIESFEHMEETNSGEIFVACTNPMYINMLLQNGIYTTFIQNLTLLEQRERKMILDTFTNISESEFCASMLEINIFYYLFAWCCGSERSTMFGMQFLYACKITINLIENVKDDAIAQFLESKLADNLPEYWDKAHLSESIDVYFAFIMELNKYVVLVPLLDNINISPLFESILESYDAEMICSLLEFLSSIAEMSIDSNSAQFLQNVASFLSDEYTASQLEDLAASEEERMSDLAQHLLSVIEENE